MEGKQEGINSQAKTYHTQGDKNKKKINSERKEEYRWNSVVQ
jgi:hypothetical protein